MILTIDTGNTNICLSLHDAAPKPLFMDRIPTDRTRAAESYKKELKKLLSRHRIPKRAIEGVVFSSVVVCVTETFLPVLRAYFSCPIIPVNYDLDLGFKSLVDDPYTIGADILADGAGALSEYPLPLLTFDLGTAAVASFYNEKGEHEGVFISPGVRTSLNSLSSVSPALSGLSFDPPETILGQDLSSAVRSGLIFGFAGLIDGITDHIGKAIGKPVTVVVTGGFSTVIAPHCRHEVHIEPELLMKGLYQIWLRNH